MYVDIKNLSFSYFNIDILHDINLQVAKKQIVLLVGENGAGKTTLLRLLAGKNTATKFNKFEVMGNRNPHDQINGISYLGNTWTRSVSFAGMVPYMIDMEAKNFMKKWQEENLERRDELVKVLEINLDWIAPNRDLHEDEEPKIVDFTG